MRRFLTELALVLGVGLLLASVWTWPLLPNLGQALPFDPASAGPTGSDMHIWTWNFWWAGQVVSGAGTPFYSDAIFLPLGHSLVFHTHSFFWGLLTLPLQWLFGVPFAVGAALLLLPATAFAAAYLLARDLGTSRPAAGLAGLGWAFAPYFAQKGLEHLCFAATPWPPLLVLFLLRWMRHPVHDSAGPWRSALGAGTVLGLGLLSGSLVGLYLVVLAALVVLLAPGSGKDGARTPRRMALVEPRALLLFLVTCWVLAWPLLTELRLESASLAASADAAAGLEALGREVVARPSLADFLRLSSHHPLGTVPEGAPPGWNESSALHISAALIVLAALAVGRGRGLGRWLVLAVVGLLLTWDPVVAKADGGFFSALYHRLPYLDALRVPARFMPLVLLPLAILGAFGLDRLRRRSAKAAVVLVLVLVAESWTRAVPLMDVTAPPAVAALAEAPMRAGGGDGVLTLPVPPGASKAMTWQAWHGRPVVFSYVARANPRATSYWLQATPDLFSLAVPRLRPDGSMVAPTPLSLSIDLANVGVGDVLVDEARLEAGAPELLELLLELLDQMPGWERQAVEGTVAWWRRVA